MTVCLALVLALAGQPRPEDATASQARFFQEARWTTTTHMADVAEPVVTLLHARVAARIADHGEAFNPTDVRAGDDAPGVRLVLAGHAGKRWFVCLEVGGVAHGLYFTMFEVTGGTARLVLFALGAGVEHSETPQGWEVDLAELKAAFREKRLTAVDPAPYLLKE